MPDLDDVREMDELNVELYFFPADQVTPDPTSGTDIPSIVAVEVK
jgi:hypothetical protein